MVTCFHYLRAILKPFETPYLPYGLKIAAISSKKLGDVQKGKLSNPFLYNGKELLDEDMDLGWYDYGFRDYDPQIGRFTELDPLTWQYPELTNYQYASCDPVTNIDVDGLEGSNVLGGLVSATECVFGSFGGAASTVSNAVQTASTIAKTSFNVLDFTMHLVESATKIVNTINGAFGSSGVRYASNNPGADGISDAWKNAVSGGLWDLAGAILGTNPVSNYTTNVEKEEYLKNRIAADISLGGIAAAVARTGDAAAADSQLIALALAETGVGTIGAEIVAAVAKGIAIYAKTVVGATMADVALMSTYAIKYMAAPSYDNPPARYDGPKPKYATGEHYENDFNKGSKNKTALPDDAEEVYKNAIPGDQTNPKTWFGINKDGNVYRYSVDNNGVAHFSGRSDIGKGIRNLLKYAKDRLKALNPNVNFGNGAKK